MIRQGALTIGLMVAGASFSFAETPEQRQACMDSAFQVCNQFIPDRERVFACLLQNKDVIAPLCREALAPYLPPDPPPKQAAKSKTKKTATKTNSKKVAQPLSLNPKAR